MKMSTKNAASIDDLGGNYARPGRYHAVMKAADEEKYDDVLMVEFELLEGTIPGQSGKTHMEFFRLHGKDDKTTETLMKRVAKLAVITGMMGFGEEREVDWKRECVGRQLVIELVEEEYEGKKRNRIEFKAGMWKLTDPEVKDVPKDKTAMGLYSSAPGAGGTGAAGQPASGAKPANKWGDI